MSMSLAAFRVFSLFFIYSSFTLMCVDMVSIIFILLGFHRTSLVCGFMAISWKILSYYFSLTLSSFLGGHVLVYYCYITNYHCLLSLSNTHLLAHSSKFRSPDTAWQAPLLRVSQAEIKLLAECVPFWRLWENPLTRLANSVSLDCKKWGLPLLDSCALGPVLALWVPHSLQHDYLHLQG